MLVVTTPTISEHRIVQHLGIVGAMPFLVPTSFGTSLPEFATSLAADRLRTKKSSETPRQSLFRRCLIRLKTWEQTQWWV